MFFYYLLVIFAGPFFRVLYPLFVVNKKRLKGVKNKGVIFAANHQSTTDVPYMLVNIPRYQRFVAKKELSKNPIFKFLFWSIGTYSIERGKPNLFFYKDATAKLKAGGALTIFPEGTRKKDESTEEMLELKNGVAMFAIKSGCHIVPIYIDKKAKLFRINRLFVGEPFTLTEFEKVSKDNLNAATQIISQKFDEVRQEAVEYKAAKKAKKK